MNIAATCQVSVVKKNIFMILEYYFTISPKYKTDGLDSFQNAFKFKQKSSQAVPIFQILWAIKT